MDVGRPAPAGDDRSVSRTRSSRELAEVERHIRIRQFRAGQTVVGYQDDLHDLFFILSGKLKVTIFSEAGREVAFRELNPGHSFGELSAIDGQPRSANVIALTDATVGSMTAPDFLTALRRQPAVALATLRKLTLLVRALSERVQKFAKKVEVRICHELLRLARELDAQQQRGARQTVAEACRDRQPGEHASGGGNPACWAS